MAQNQGTSAVPSHTRKISIEQLTRDQHIVLGRLTAGFREGGSCQILTGPSECGKTVVSELVTHCLDQEIVPVFISKRADKATRTMIEAYGSYAHLLLAILKPLGFVASGEESDLVEQMVERLRQLRSENRRLLVIIDDAQDMTPGVWKRLHSWLTYQQEGKRMLQFLFVGTPQLRKLLSEPLYRGWKRWINGTHSLSLLTTHRAVEEARGMLKHMVDEINTHENVEQKYTAPVLTWFAAVRIAHNSGGSPGRLHELISRALNTSIRAGGVNITRRFLVQADALKTTAQQVQKTPKSIFKRSARETPANQDKKAAVPSTPAGVAVAARAKGATPTGQPLDWMRYALGLLFIVFIIGAGWGVTAWFRTAPDGTPSGYDDSLVAEEGSSELVRNDGVAEETDLVAEAPVVETILGTSDTATADASDPWAVPAVESVSTIPPAVDNTIAPSGVPVREVTNGWNSLDTSVAQVDAFSDSIESTLGMTGPIAGAPLGTVSGTAPIKSPVMVATDVSIPPLAPIAEESLAPLVSVATKTSENLAPKLPETTTTRDTTVASASKSGKEPSTIVQEPASGQTSPVVFQPTTDGTKGIVSKQTSQSASNQPTRLERKKKALEALRRLEKKLGN
jgi:type II secretory pathway predicted ATPase ExeA